MAAGACWVGASDFIASLFAMIPMEIKPIARASTKTPARMIHVHMSDSVEAGACRSCISLTA